KARDLRARPVGHPPEAGAVPRELPLEAQNLGGILWIVPVFVDAQAVPGIVFVLSGISIAGILARRKISGDAAALTARTATSARIRCATLTQVDRTVKVEGNGAWLFGARTVGRSFCALSRDATPVGLVFDAFSHCTRGLCRRPQFGRERLEGERLVH